jgi:hypothetical protein
LILVGVKNAERTTLPRIDGFHEQVAFIFGEVPVVAFRMQPVIALPAA